MSQSWSHGCISILTVVLLLLNAVHSMSLGDYLENILSEDVIEGKFSKLEANTNRYSA